jgi:hypothetical protein
MQSPCGTPQTHHGRRRHCSFFISGYKFKWLLFRPRQRCQRDNDKTLLGGNAMIFKLSRHIGALALCAMLAGPAFAQPMDELTLIAPAAPGGGWDGTARAMAEVLQQAGLV